MSEDSLKIFEDKIKRQPSREHELTYESSSETLEPIYFWILDYMNKRFSGKVEKITDNFASSPGSGHFAEFSQRKTILQENVMKNLGAINQVIRTIVNLVYDLKDFEIRLKHYEDSSSEDKGKKEASMLALKQIWMDNVDIKRGQGSINGLTSGNLQFVTLRDAFMIANSVKEVDDLDLNDRVKRILKPRIAEFLEWKKLSEQELKKRFNIEKNYLRSQVNTLQLYSKWIKPYLKYASELEMGIKGENPELVTAFNTIVLELTLVGKKEIDIKEAINTDLLPKGLSKLKRKYYAVVTIDFHFRGIPQKAGQHYVFGGRAIVKFKGYGLNEDELKFFNQELKKSELNDVMKLIQGSTTESLDEMKKDIDYFLEDKKEEENKKSEDTNPFSALFSLFKNNEKKEKEDTKEILIKDIKKDSYSESLVRKLAEDVAEDMCFNIFDVYKKTHGMPSHDDPFE